MKKFKIYICVVALLSLHACSKKEECVCNVDEYVGGVLVSSETERSDVNDDKYSSVHSWDCEDGDNYDYSYTDTSGVIYLTDRSGCHLEPED